MTMWNEFLGNQILISAVLGWTVAQFLKTVIDMVIGITTWKNSHFSHRQRYPHFL